MEKDNRNSSEDILTRFSLLTDDVNVNSIKGWPYIKRIIQKCFQL